MSCRTRRFDTSVNTVDTSRWCSGDERRVLGPDTPRTHGPSPGARSGTSGKPLTGSMRTSQPWCLSRMPTLGALISSRSEGWRRWRDETVVGATADGLRRMSRNNQPGPAASRSEYQSSGGIQASPVYRRGSLLTAAAIAVTNRMTARSMYSKNASTQTMSNSNKPSTERLFRSR